MRWSKNQIQTDTAFQAFRTRGGLYDNHNQDVFTYCERPSQERLERFNAAVSRLRDSSAKANASPAHSFLGWLEDSGRLTRCYSMNVDNLESRVGLQGLYTVDGPSGQLHEQDLDSVRVVQMHGSVHWVRCSICFLIFEYRGEDKCSPCASCE